MDPPTCFDDLLSQRNPHLHAQLVDIRARSFDDWIPLLKPDMGSHAGYVHLRNVERNADKMIPARSKAGFSDGEIFVLLASVLFHDIGRILPDGKNDARPLCPLSGVECEDSGHYKPMGTHACNSRNFIERLWATLGLPDVHIARYCALVTFWHGFKLPPIRGSACGPAAQSSSYFSSASVEPYGPLRLPLLAAILRIADEAENCWTRALRNHWYEAFVRDGREPTEVAKAFRRYVEDVEFSPEGECIIMHLPAENESDKLIAKVLDGVAATWAGTCEVLREWAVFLAPADVAYSHVFIDIAGRLHTGPKLAEPGESFGAALEDTDGIRAPYLERGSVERYFNAILSLVRGTRGYHDFRWSAIEGAIREPLTPRIQWVIERMGKVTPAFRVIRHPNTDSVQVSIDMAKIGETQRLIYGVAPHANA